MPCRRSGAARSKTVRTASDEAAQLAVGLAGIASSALVRAEPIPQLIKVVARPPFLRLPRLECAA